MCCGVPAFRGQMKEKHPVRKTTKQGVPEMGGSALPGLRCWLLLSWHDHGEGPLWFGNKEMVPKL